MKAIDTLITMTESPGGRFRLAAIAEAWSWAGLLAGMCCKYLIVHDPIGVQIMGPIHGALFVVYIVAALQAAKRYRWSAIMTLVAIVASIPPLTTWPFERFALKRGMLSESRASSPR